MTLPYACAGVVFHRGYVVEAAPIFGWAVGKKALDFIEWVHRKRGGLTYADGHRRPDATGR